MALLPQREDRRIKMPLTRVIGLGFGAFVAISLALVLGLSVMANFKNTFSLLNDKTILVTQSMERQVRDYFNSAEQAVVALKPFFDSGAVEFATEQSALADMSMAVASNPALTVLVLTDLSGERLGVYKAPDGKLWSFTNDKPPPGERAYELPDLTQESGPKWGPLVTNNVGVFANVSVPIVRDGVMVGALTAASSLDRLEETLAVFDDGPTATTFIIAGNDEVVVHSDLTMFQSGDLPVGALPSARLTLGDPVLAAMDNEEVLSEFQRAADLGIEVSLIEAADDEFIMMRAVIPGFSDRPWIIGQYYQSASISREVQRLTGSAFVGFVALIITVLIAVWIGRRVARPLRELARQSERVGSLSLDQVEPLPRSRVAELDQVALAFNAMVEGLKAMNTYVPRSLFIKLMRLGGQQAAEAREAELTILFTDIVGFTAYSETMSASETARQLNDHFAILVEAVEEEGGTVDKFIGDGMLAFWGAPDARADHAEAAVRAARKIAAEQKCRNEAARRAGRPEMRMRMGIHTGTAVVGNVGALDRWNYTVVGDTVNTAERLQSLGKDYGIDEETVILASGETTDRLPLETALTEVGAVYLRGRSGEMNVWKLAPEGGAARQTDVAARDLTASPPAAE